MDKLDEMILLQKTLMDRLGVDRIRDDQFDDDYAVECVQKKIPHFMFALMCEMGEIGDAINWKSWKKERKPVDTENLRMEFIDALHFLLEMMIMFGMTSDMIHKEYVKKNEENHARQDRGY